MTTTTKVSDLPPEKLDALAGETVELEPTEGGWLCRICSEEPDPEIRFAMGYMKDAGMMSLFAKDGHHCPVHKSERGKTQELSDRGQPRKISWPPYSTDPTASAKLCDAARELGLFITIRLPGPKGVPQAAVEDSEDSEPAPRVAVFTGVFSDAATKERAIAEAIVLWGLAAGRVKLP